MRIVVLTNADIGLYKFRKELIERLCKVHEVYIVLPHGEYVQRLEEFGCRFVPFEFNRRGKNPFADLNQFCGYVRLLKKIKPDLVLTYTIKPNVYGGLACQRLKIPYIANVTGLGTSIENGSILRYVSMSLYSMGLKGASCVFFQNKANRKLFVNNGIVKGKTRLIPGSGVNLEAYALEPYPSEEDGVRFLFVGRIMKDKGIEELLAAIREIRRKRSDVLVDVVGGCEDNYLDVLQELEESGSIRYYGSQSDVHSFYSNCHCVVLPSYHEGTSNVLLEASSTGRPVIATNVPGCRETFDEGVTGFGCEVKNADSLKDAMEKFLALSHEKKKEMGLAAREKVKKEYDRNIVIKAYWEEILECIEGRVVR